MRSRNESSFATSFFVQVCWALPAAALALGIALMGLPSYFAHLLALAVIASVLAGGLNIVVGLTGLNSFGHAAFSGVAAYAAAILATRYGVGFWPAAAAGVGLAWLLGAAFGAVAAFHRDVYFVLLTIALGQTLWGIANRWSSVTGGENGLVGWPRPVPAWLDGIDEQRARAMVVAGLALIGWFALFALWRSPLGRSLRGIRDSESRMQSLGYSVWAHKWIAISLSGLFSGMAGVLHAYYLGFVSPADLHVSVSAQALLMVVLGGKEVFLGPALGALFIVLLQGVLGIFTERWNTILGLLYVAVMFYLPGGAAGWLVGITRRSVGARELAASGIEQAPPMRN